MSKATSSNAAKGSPCLTRGRPSVWTHWPTIPDPTWAHACCLAGWPLEGSATTSIAPLRRFQPSEVCPGRPAGVASAGKEEIAASGHGPQTFLEAQGAQPVRTPGPCVYVGGGLPASPLLVLEFGSPWAWKVRRPRDCRTPRAEDTVRPPEAERQRGRWDLDRLPRGKGQPPA